MKAFVEVSLEFGQSDNREHIMLQLPSSTCSDPAELAERSKAVLQTDAVRSYISKMFELEVSNAFPDSTYVIDDDAHGLSIFITGIDDQQEVARQMVISGLIAALSTMFVTPANLEAALQNGPLMPPLNIFAEN